MTRGGGGGRGESRRCGEKTTLAVCPAVYLPASPTLMKKKGATPLRGDLSVQVHTLHIP